MTNKLISLVLIVFILSIGHSYSGEQVLFPKEKPSIFKKIKKDEGQNFSNNFLVNVEAVSYTHLTLPTSPKV